MDGMVTTSTIETVFSLFSRVIVGSFHKVSKKHLHRCLSEFETRFNARKKEDRFETTLRRMLGIEAMPYAEVNSDQAGLLSR